MEKLTNEEIFNEILILLFDSEEENAMEQVEELLKQRT